MVALAPLQLRGVAVPRILYGTAWKEERTQALTTLALSAGFRGIDTANQRKHYFEAAVGSAVAAARERHLASRSELFLQSKFTFLDGQDERLPYDRHASVGVQVRQSFDSSLEHLHTDYLDSYVLHGPSTRSGLAPADFEAWQAMELLHRASRVRLLGVSNVTLAQLTALVEAAQVKPAFVQNRCFARTGWDRKLRGYCRANDIVYQGFSLLTANRAELQSAQVQQLSQRTGRSAAELVFRFALQLGMLPLTGTSNPEHMRLDLDSLELELDAADEALLERLAG